MIIRFPKLDKKNAQKLKKWLNDEKIELNKDMTSYAACGNYQNAAIIENEINFCEYILMMMKYHEK